MSTPAFNPLPCCGDGEEALQSNLMVSDVVCAELDGESLHAVRQVLFNPDGGDPVTTIIGPDGSVMVPDSWTPGPCATAALASLGAHEQILCDSGNGGHQFLRRLSYTDGVVTDTQDTELDGTTPYVVAGLALVCVNDFTTTGLCLGDGTPIGIVNRRTLTGAMVQDGWVNLITGVFFPGIPPVGTTACGRSVSVQMSDVLCDITTATGVVNGLVLVQYTYAPDGSIDFTTLINATTGAPYGPPIGVVTVCPSDIGQPDRDMQVLCDVQGDGTVIPLVRDYRRDPVGVINGFADYTVGGVPYLPTGTVGSCIPRGVEGVVLCDSNGSRFVRSYVYNPAGVIISVLDTTLAGAPFVPVGAVGICPDPAVPAPVSAQHQDVVPGSPWTPPVGAVITGLSYAVISGTATVTDQNGGVSTLLPTGLTFWYSGDDGGVLLPPQQIASVGGRVHVGWTMR